MLIGNLLHNLQTGGPDPLSSGDLARRIEPRRTGLIQG